MPSRFKDDIYDDKKYSTNRTDKTRYAWKDTYAELKCVTRFHIPDDFTARNLSDFGIGD